MPGAYVASRRESADDRSYAPPCCSRIDRLHLDRALRGACHASLRSELASQTSGFWTSYTKTELGHRFSTHDKGDKTEVTELAGNIFERLNKDDPAFPIAGEVQSILFKGRVPDRTSRQDETDPQAGAAGRGDGCARRGLHIPAERRFQLDLHRSNRAEAEDLEAIINQDPVFGGEAYAEVLLENKNVPNALISSFIVTIPATIIPITIAAFAAYAFSWMRFPT